MAAHDPGGGAPASRYQRRWLAAYWAAAALNLAFLVLALGGDDVSGAAYFAVTTGSVASLLGSTMATHVHLRGVDDRDFDEATSIMRAVAVAWLLLSLFMVCAVVAATDFGATATVDPARQQDVLDVADGLAAQLFGAAALLVVVGDGYARYRRLLAVHPATPSRASRRRRQARG